MYVLFTCLLPHRFLLCFPISKPQCLSFRLDLEKGYHFTDISLAQEGTVSPEPKWREKPVDIPDAQSVASYKSSHSVCLVEGALT